MTEMPGRLNGKIALITGGCSGIGLATTELFVREGAKVLVADLQDDKGAALEQRFSGAVVYCNCDVTRESDIGLAFAKVKTAFGGLDILFNNAGVGGDPSGVATMTIEGWDATQNLLLRAPMLGIKHAIPLMEARGGGSIINTASIAGLEAGWGLAYSVAKAGVIHLTKLTSAELAGRNIRVNTICPGVIVTPLFGLAAGRSRADADKVAGSLVGAAAAMQPIRRAGTAEDVARATLYFASDESSFTTGTQLVVDGGITVGSRASWDVESKTPIAKAVLALASEASPSKMS